MKDEDKEYRIFRSAHEGDYEPLIKLIESGANLNTPDRRALLRKIIAGEMPRVGHRQKNTLKDEERKEAISDRVEELYVGENAKMMSAVKQVAEEFGCSETTVRAAVRWGRKQFRDAIEFLTLIASMSPDELKARAEKARKAVAEHHDRKYGLTRSVLKK